MKEQILLTDNSGHLAVYELQPKEKYKKLRTFVISGSGIYRINSIGHNYYWADGIKQGGDWYRGGYYTHPFINNFCDVFVDIIKNEVYKFKRKLK